MLQCQPLPAPIQVQTATQPLRGCVCLSSEMQWQGSIPRPSERLYQKVSGNRPKKRTATCELANTSKNAIQLGNSVTNSCTPVTFAAIRPWPNVIKGAIDVVAACLVEFGLMRIATPDVENPPHPSLAHVNPLSARIVQSSLFSVLLLGGGVYDKMTVCNVTRGDARMVLSSTTPNVPPPPRKQFSGCASLRWGSLAYRHEVRKIGLGSGKHSPF